MLFLEQSMKKKVRKVTSVLGCALMWTLLAGILFLPSLRNAGISPFLKILFALICVSCTVTAVFPPALRCPFCGSKAFHMHQPPPEFPTPFAQVICDMCLAMGPPIRVMQTRDHRMDQAIQGAAEAWEQRV